MTHLQDLAKRLGAMLDSTSPDEDPAIWAVRCCGVIATTIGSPEITKEQIVEALETLYVLCPDRIISASAEISHIINNNSRS